MSGKKFTYFLSIYYFKVGETKSFITNSVPWPLTLWAVIVPLCISIKFFTTIWRLSAEYIILPVGEVGVDERCRHPNLGEAEEDAHILRPVNRVEHLPTTWNPNMQGHTVYCV